MDPRHKDSNNSTYTHRGIDRDRTHKDSHNTTYTHGGNGTAEESLKQSLQYLSELSGQNITLDNFKNCLYQGSNIDSSDDSESERNFKDNSSYADSDDLDSRKYSTPKKSTPATSTVTSPYFKDFDDSSNSNTSTEGSGENVQTRSKKTKTGTGKLHDIIAKLGASKNHNSESGTDTE